MWTQFWDMHSGGGLKESPYHYIYIEAPLAEAKVIFYNRFKHNPQRVTCTCCGEDYVIDESPTLELASCYQRGCRFVYRRPDGTECQKDEAWQPGKGRTEGYSSAYEDAPNQDSWRNYLTLEQYAKRKDVLIIYAKDITNEERQGTIPQQGYVWVD